MVRWQDVQDLLEGRTYRSGKTGTTLAAFLIGATIGATAGLLLAPQSGEETREKLKQKAQAGKDKARNRATAVRETAKDKTAQVKEVTRRTVAEGKRAAQESKARSDRRGRGEVEGPVMTGLQEAFYIVAIICMSLISITFIVFLALALAIRRKVFNLIDSVQEKVDIIRDIPFIGKRMYGAARKK